MAEHTHTHADGTTHTHTHSHAHTKAVLNRRKVIWTPSAAWWSGARIAPKFWYSCLP